MRVTLEFNLPEDQEEFEQTLNAARFNHVLLELDQWLRSNIKYNDQNLSENKIEAFQECRDRLYELLSENKIDL